MNLQEQHRRHYLKQENRIDSTQRAALPLLAALLGLLASGCATTKPAYPKVEAGTPASILKLDNTMAASAWALQVLAPIGLQVTVDVFSPAEKDKLTSGGQIGQSRQLTPKGITEVRLAAGSHT